MYSFFRPTTSPYVMAVRLKGHSAAIFSLAFSPCGNLLASGGGGGVMIWNLESKQQLPSPPQSIMLRGPITCVNWITQRDDPYNTLCYGTGLGYFVVWRQVSREGILRELCAKRLATGREITCIANDTSQQSTRIAVGTRDKVVQVFILDAKGELQSVFCVQMDATVPISVSFADNIAKDVYVFGLHNGYMHILRGDDGTLLSTVEIGGMIGSAAIDFSRNQFVVDTIHDGFNLHQLDSGRWKRNYPIDLRQRKLPMQVAFGEDSKVVVGGSDHGAVYVFDRKTGSSLQVLRHGSQGLVQTIATYEEKEQSSIATASSSNCGEVSICLWVRKHPRETVPTFSRRSSTDGSVVIQLAMTIMVIIFLYQNMMPYLANPKWTDTKALEWELANILRGRPQPSATSFRSGISYQQGSPVERHSMIAMIEKMFDEAEEQESHEGDQVERLLPNRNTIYL